MAAPRPGTPRWFAGGDCLKEQAHPEKTHRPGLRPLRSSAAHASSARALLRKTSVCEASNDRPHRRVQRTIGELWLAAHRLAVGTWADFCRPQRYRHSARPPLWHPEPLLSGLRSDNSLIRFVGNLSVFCELLPASYIIPQVMDL